MEFQDNGSVGGRSTVRLLGFASRSLRARVATTLSAEAKERKEVYVVPGLAVAPHLPRSEREKLTELSHAISFSRDDHNFTAIAAFKHFIALREGGEVLNEALDIKVVAWKFGPVPVLRVGTSSGVPVFATPLPMPADTTIPPPIDEWRVTLEVISDHFSGCMRQYFREIGDQLRATFFAGDKHDALQNVRHVNRTLGESVKPKLALMRGDDDVAFLSKAEARLCRESQERLAAHGLHESEVRLYTAAASVVEVCVATIEEVLANGSPSAVSDAINEAYGHLDALIESDAEEEVLRECVNLIRHPLDNDEPPRVSRKATLDQWLVDLNDACRFVSIVRMLTRHYGRDNVFVFISHHMDVYATEEFYRQLHDLAKRQWPSGADGGRIVVWTGYGRQADILWTILAKIWLSDLHLLYLPNSWATRSGADKKLLRQRDWVVEEIFYGALSGKALHFVIARDSPTDRKPSALRAFQEQWRRYDWSSLPSAFRIDSNGVRQMNLASRLENIARVNTYTSFTPELGAIGESTRALLMDAVFKPAIKQRFRSVLLAIRMSFSREQWAVARTLYRLSRQEDDGIVRFVSVTRDDLLESLKRNRAGMRWRPNEPTDNWIRTTLMDKLSKRNVRLGEAEFCMVARIHQYQAKDHYSFALAAVVPAVNDYYGTNITRTELEAILDDVLVGSTS